MADFVQDYSALAGAGSAFNSFADAYQKAQDNKVKNQELQARTQSETIKAQREADQTAIQMKIAGLQKDPTSGQLTEAPMGPAAQGKQKLDVFKAGGKGAYDDSGNLTDVSVDPDSMNMLKIQNGLQGKQFSQGLQRDRLNLMQNRFGETQSQNASKAGKDIEEDSVMKNMTSARQSLSRGKALLNGSMPLTYNNLNAVQQDVISGMTQGGQSSEGKVNREMQESWTGRWNDALAKAGQYGPDNDIRKQDPGLYKQIQGLLTEVDSTIAKNMADRTNKLASSYSQTSNQKVKNVVNQKVQQYAPPADEPQGLVSAPGLVGKQGLVSGPPAPTAPAHPQDSVAMAWANANIKNKDPNISAKAAAIIKANGG